MSSRTGLSSPDEFLVIIHFAVSSVVYLFLKNTRWRWWWCSNGT